MIRLHKIRPIRAANIFGPALIINSFTCKYLTMFLEDRATRLYFARSAVRIKKSIARKAIKIIFCVIKKPVINRTVKVAFTRATRSFTFFSDIGQSA